MKYIFLILFPLIIGQNVSAQGITSKLKLTWSDLVWDVSGDPAVVKAFEVADGYLVFRKHPIRGPGGFKYYIEILDKNLKRKKFTDISGDIDEENYTLQDIFEFSNRYFIITTSMSKSDSKIGYFLQEVQWEKGKVDKRENIFEYTYDSKKVLSDVHVSVSPGNNYLLLVCEEPSRTRIFGHEKREADKRSFLVYDTDMKVLNKNSMIPMEYKNIEYTILQTVVNDQGAVYMLGESIVKDQNRIWEFSILKFEDKKLIANNIKFKDGLLTSLEMGIDKDGILYCGGYYDQSNGKFFSNAYGTVVMTVNPETADPIRISTKLIDTKILMEGMSAREKARMESREDRGKQAKQKLSIQAMDIIKHADGTVSLVGEVQFVEYIETTSANGGTNTKTIFHYDELFVSRVNQEGEILKTVKVQKKNAILKGHDIAFHAFDMNNDLGIIFDDHIKNMGDLGAKGIIPLTAKMSQTVFALVTVNRDGVQKREAIIDYSKKPYSAYRRYRMAKDMAVINNNNLLFVTYYGKKKFGYLHMQVQ